MRLTTLALSCLAAAVGVSTQRVNILAPAPNSTFSPGDSFVVDVNRQSTLTGSQEVSVVIALGSCVGRAPNGTCDGVDLSDALGRVLYAGPYTPQLRPGSAALFQNFTVTVPDNFPQGASVLSVVHLSLVGAGPFPFLEVVNETLTIQ